jgi:XTP/dITP diphosphohydrolase
MELVIATGNRHKFREIAARFSEIHGLIPVHAGDLGEMPRVEETGSTFRDNALIKARAFSRWSNLPALADDSGLEVDALKGRPGVYSARYGGPELDDGERNLLLLSEMEKVPDEKRTARFVCVMALALPGGDEWTVRGECPGMITRHPSGREGFGYDPVFYLPEKGFTMAEISPGEKNRISHRARALDLALTRLQTMIHG